MCGVVPIQHQGRRWRIAIATFRSRFHKLYVASLLDGFECVACRFADRTSISAGRRVDLSTYRHDITAEEGDPHADVEVWNRGPVGSANGP
jgi:hypothetical protein